MCTLLPSKADPKQATPVSDLRQRRLYTIDRIWVWQRGRGGFNLNARETDRDAAPAPGRTADAVPKGYSDWVRQARVFPGPPGSRPARSLVYTHSGDTYKATIGRPRRRYAHPRQSGSATAKASRTEGEESGSTVIAIVVTDRLVEIWSQEPAQGWANPSLVRHDEITKIQYLR
jgi:hypothetical protein